MPPSLIGLTDYLHRLASPIASPTMTKDIIKGIMTGCCYHAPVFFAFLRYCFPFPLAS
ncbi:MAG: hypothetical protein K0U36_02165 [Alphaproteobacteria bacterium]|nr:hypothetical protein [Alphaproteobacteria bacterium]